jgi:DNA-binding transcriptional LysR family regulator
MNVMAWSDRIKHRLKLRDLDILMTVIQAGGMGKAARQLRMAQPAVSKAISELERTLGVRLLDRSRHGAQPTPYGLSLARHGTVVFDQLRQSIADIDFLADPAAGEIRMGATEPIAAAIVAPLIDQLSRQYPRLAFHVVIGDTMTLYRELAARNVEFVLSRVIGAPVEQQVVDVLFDDPLVVVTATNHPLARRRKIALAELMEEPWIMGPAEGYFGASQAAVFLAAGLKSPRVVVTTASANLRSELLATGHFITLLPSFSLRLPHRQSWLKILPVALPDTRMPIAITTMRNRSLSRAAETFLRAVREWVKPLSA